MNANRWILGMVILHYWGTGSAGALASVFRAALDELGPKRVVGHP